MTTNTYIYNRSGNTILTFAFIGLGLMLGSVMYAVFAGSLFSEWPVIMSLPWGLVSIVDLYIGLVLFCFWIIRRESLSLRGLCWILMVLSLGNMISCLYVIKACIESKGNMVNFWLGTHHD